MINSTDHSALFYSNQEDFHDNFGVKNYHEYPRTSNLNFRQKKKTCSVFQIFAFVILFSFSSHPISCFLNLLPRRESLQCSLVSTKFYSQGWKGKNSLCASDVEKFIELNLFNGDACYAFS